MIREFGGLVSIVILAFTASSAMAHPHNTVDILEPPAPIFPDDTVAPGRCEVRFEIRNYTDIKVTGAECSDYIFCKPSRVAVEAAKLRVVDNNGEEGPGVAQNIVYPLEFTFGVPSDRQLAWINAQPLFPCDQALMF
ncbi:MAG: hypothetical protein AAGL99_17175 [Pseudomonadota bacterium]